MRANLCTFILTIACATIFLSSPSRADFPFAAVQTGDLRTIQSALDNGQDINSRNSTGDTPLHIAARFDQLDTVKFLLNHGATLRLDILPNPISVALEFDHPNIATYLVTYAKEHPQPIPQPRLNPTDELSRAIITGDLAALDRLLSAKPAPDFDAILAATSLARQHGRLAIEQRLITAHAPFFDRNAQWTKSGNDLINSIRFKQYQQVDGLLIRGADPNFIDEHGNSALHIAIDSDDPRFVSLLMRHNADPLKTSPRLRRSIPLWDAATKNKKEALAAMLTGRESPTQLSHALYLAVGNIDSIEIVQLLLKKGANPNYSPLPDETILKRATKNSDKQVIQALIAAGARS